MNFNACNFFKKIFNRNKLKKNIIVFSNYEYFYHENLNHLVYNINQDLKNTIGIELSTLYIDLYIKKYVKDYLAYIDKYIDKGCLLDIENIAVVFQEYNFVVNLNVAKIIKTYRKNIRKKTYDILYKALESFNF